MEKEEHSILIPQENIKSRIYTLRGMQVMLDKDLAELYNVKTKRLNEQVRRNIDRFPQEFMFQLTDFEVDSLRSQFATSNIIRRESQNAIPTNLRGGRRYLPYAFTEQGVAMLSGVLKSDIAVRTSIQIINTFVAMRKFLASNAQIFQRLDHVEQKQLEHNQKFEEIFDAIQSRDIKPDKGIFFDGQIFDAYTFVSDLIRRAHHSIVLIDNYIDDSVLTLLNKRNKEVKVTIFTKEISKQLTLDLAKYNSQYPCIEVKEFKQSHDRFLIVDTKEVYHFGASLKDLGKKWFAFSKFDKDVFQLLEKLKLK